MTRNINEAVRTRDLYASTRILASPPDALDYRRFETRGFLRFLHPGVRPPREPQVQVVRWFHRRVEAF